MVYFLYISGADDELCFEFDGSKSRANEAKHGIGFVEAQALWLDGSLFESPARSEQEQRFMVVGMIAGTYWSAFITYRGERIRIISVRRSRSEEVESYGSKHRGE